LPSPSSPPPSRGSASRWAWIVGLGVSLALLGLALRGVQPREFVDHLRNANPALMLATIGLATLTFPLRTIRWRLILRDAKGGALPLGPLWHATAIGFMANNLLPVRAGEFARAYVAQQALSVRFTTALASVGVERVCDGLMLVALLAVALVAPSFPRDTTLGGRSIAGLAQGFAALFGIALGLALLVVHRPAPWLALLRRLAHAVLPARFAERVIHAAEGLVAGLAVLKSPGRLLGVVGWSLVLWLVNAASFAVCFRAFGFPVPAEGALLLQGVIGFGVALPSSPGFVGVFEVATKATLAVYGIDATRALSYAVGYHVSTFLPITLLGLYSLSRMRLHLAELRARAGTAA
jgi:glycosyltransferase 2 family protein